MALNISEAHDVNVLVDYLCALPNAGGRIPGGDEARDALARLADKAHRSLMAGADEVVVRTNWLLPESAEHLRHLAGNGKVASGRGRKRARA